MRFLMRNPHRVLSKAQILDRVWHYDFGSQSNVVELYVSYLRNKIDAGTTVTVELRRGPDGGALLTVRDDGPGIAAEILPRVFERFARGAASRTRTANDIPSTGLGLAIVSAVVAAHGGTMSVDSVPGRTTFTVAVPAHVTAGVRSASAPG